MQPRQTNLVYVDISRRAIGHTSHTTHNKARRETARERAVENELHAFTGVDVRDLRAVLAAELLKLGLE